MALSARDLPSLFLIVLLSSLQAQARDSQFFSKVPTITTTTTTTTTNDAQETVEVPSRELPLKKQDREPNFNPDTQNGYGLYGHETGLLPPSTTTKTTAAATTTTTTLPQKTESSEPFPITNSNTNTNNYYYNQNAYATDTQGMSDARGYTATSSSNSNPNNYYDYNKDAFVTVPRGMSDTRFMDRGYTTPITTTNNYYNGANNYNNEGFRGSMFMDRGYTTPTNRYNIQQQQQGMSDTRFLENGKYYYDLNMERIYPDGYQSSTGMGYGNQGYYGKNGNPYEYSNSMENQEEFQEEGQEEYVP